MCVIAAKPANVAMFDKQTLKNMCVRNPDGCGICFPYKGKVHIVKGLMTAEDAWAALQMWDEEVDFFKNPVIFHARISTAHGVNAALTHPFPLTNNIDYMRELECDAEVGIAHNGIIDIDYGPRESDTMAFIRRMVYPVSRICKKWYQNDIAMGMLDDFCDSKLAIMRSNGELAYVGNFIEENGIYYSNSSYLGYQGYSGVYKSAGTTGGYSSYSSGVYSCGSFDNPPWDSDSVGYDYNDYCYENFAPYNTSLDTPELEEEFPTGPCHERFLYRINEDYDFFYDIASNVIPDPDVHFIDILGNVYKAKECSGYQWFDYQEQIICYSTFPHSISDEKAELLHVRTIRSDMEKFIGDTYGC